MTVLTTLQNNKRDIIAGVAVTIGCALVADGVAYLSIKYSGLIWLANFAAVLSGAAKFFAANMVAFLCLAVAWPTINKFSNERFGEVWKEQFSDRDKLIALLCVACTYVLAAAISLGS